MIMAIIGIMGTVMAASHSGSYLVRVAHALECARGDISAMQPVADRAATALASGGKLWTAGQPSLVSEISGRAGGFMMIRPLGNEAPNPRDVVMYIPENVAETPDSLKNTQALVVAFGTKRIHKQWPFFPNHSEEAGISPTLANAIPAWLFTGELIAALTRLGKMPVIYESIGAYSGIPRITQYKNGEITFHDDKQVPPAAAGIVANRYINTIQSMLERVEREQRRKLDKTGAWCRAARKRGAQLFMYSMGHLFPDEVGKTEIGKLFHSDVWNAGFRTSPKPNDVYRPGDMIVLIGYQQPPDDLLRKARPAGARVAFTALRHERDFAHDRGVIWIDPMWDWPDACVPLEGYDVPLLAASGLINGAIAWEIHRLTVQGQ